MNGLLSKCEASDFCRDFCPKGEESSDALVVFWIPSKTPLPQSIFLLLPEYFIVCLPQPVPLLLVLPRRNRNILLHILSDKTLTIDRERDREISKELWVQKKQQRWNHKPICPLIVCVEHLYKIIKL